MWARLGLLCCCLTVAAGCDSSTPTRDGNDAPDGADAAAVQDATQQDSPSSDTQAADSSADAANPSFSSVDDLNTQRDELLAHVDTALPSRVGLSTTEVAQHPRNSQYDAAIKNECTLGGLACGPVAVAGVFRDSDYDRAHIARWIRAEAGTDYGVGMGIQPLALAQAMGAVFGSEQVHAHADWTFGDLYEALRAEQIVIVDLRVGPRGGDEVPATEAPNYAHFARVLAIDVTTQRIYLENSLLGESVWDITWAEFWEVWKFPEVLVSIQPAPEIDNVTRWAVVFARQGALDALPPAAQVAQCTAHDWVSTCLTGKTLLRCGPSLAQRVSCDASCVDEIAGWHDHCEDDTPPRRDELAWLSPCLN